MKSMATTEFIGREEEIRFLFAWLTSNTQPPIVYLYDVLDKPEQKGGIGKTWLLRKFYERVKEEFPNVIPVMVDLFTIADRDSITISRRVVQTLRERYPSWSADRFDGHLNAHLDQAGNHNGDRMIPHERLAEALAADLLPLREQMVRDDAYLLLLFDTYELIEYDPVTAVLHSDRPFPDTYQLDRIRTVIAGRNALDFTLPNWKGREQEIQVRALAPFNKDETTQYLRTHLNAYDIDAEPPEVLQTLYDRTEGRPIMVELVVEVLNRRVRSLADLLKISQPLFEASLVQEIQNFADPGKLVLFAMAHIYHRFDLAFLGDLLNWPGLKGHLPKMRYQEVAQELQQLPFVRTGFPGAGGVSDYRVFVLHDEMRRLLNQYCIKANDPLGTIRRELSFLAVNRYTRLIAHEENDELNRSYMVERLFHELFLNIEEGFQAFARHFEHALDFSFRAFARALLHELEPFKSQLSEEQHQLVLLAEIRLLREEEKSEAALEIINQAEQSARVLEACRSDFLFEKGCCYLHLDQYGQAIECFTSCLNMEQAKPDWDRQALLLDRLGYAHRLLGQYVQAMNYYEEALNYQRRLDNQQEYANLLNNLGNALRLQARLEDARRNCQMALRIRRTLVAEKKISEYDVGLSLSTLGHIYHTLGELVQEEAMYQEAFEIYYRLGDHNALAGAYNCLGRVWIRKGDLEKAREQFIKALEMASGISRSAMALIESYHRLGRVALLRNELQEALSHFEQAENLACQLDLKFPRAKNLLYLADVQDRLGFPSEQYITEAKRIARANDYSYLQALAEDIQGDICLRRQEYQNACKHYGVACRHVAPRGNPEFSRMLRKLHDVLLDIPSDFQPGTIDALLSYWYERKLDERYPELLDVCRGVSKHMLL